MNCPCQTPEFRLRYLSGEPWSCVCPCPEHACASKASTTVSALAFSANPTSGPCWLCNSTDGRLASKFSTAAILCPDCYANADKLEVAYAVRRAALRAA